MAAPVCETIITDMTTAIDAVTVQAGDNVTIQYVGRYDDIQDSPDSKRPAVILRWLGDSYSSVDGDSERTLSTQIEALVFANLDTTSSNASDKQISLTAYDVAASVTGIDYPNKDYDLGSFLITPLASEDPDEPAIGARIVFTFTCFVDYQDISTVTGPGG